MDGRTDGRTDPFQERRQKTGISRRMRCRFLDAPSHLYKRVCLSVRPSVRPWVRPLALRKTADLAHLMSGIRPCFRSYHSPHSPLYPHLPPSPLFVTEEKRKKKGPDTETPTVTRKMFVVMFLFYFLMGFRGLIWNYFFPSNKKTGQ